LNITVQADDELAAEDESNLEPLCTQKIPNPGLHLLLHQS